MQDGRHEIQFFDISTSDGGDFPHIIEIALYIFNFTMRLHVHARKCILTWKSSCPNVCFVVLILI